MYGSVIGEIAQLLILRRKEAMPARSDGENGLYNGNLKHASDRLQSPFYSLNIFNLSLIFKKFFYVRELITFFLFYLLNVKNFEILTSKKEAQRYFAFKIFQGKWKQQVVQVKVNKIKNGFYDNFNELKKVQLHVTMT